MVPVWRGGLSRPIRERHLEARMSRLKTRHSVRQALFGAGMVVIAAMLHPGTARAENLTDAMVGAYNTSGLLEQNRALLRAADEDVAIAASTLRPVVDFIVAAQRDYSTTGSSSVAGVTTNTTSVTAQLGLDWLIWDNGARRLSLDAARETVLATRQSLVAVEQNILLRAVAAYFNVVLQSENVALQRNNLRLLGEELRAAQDRFDVGEVTRTDVALAESRVAATRSALSAALGGLSDARAEYANAVGRQPGQLVGRTSLPAGPRSLADAQALAVRSHPSILAAQHQVAAAELTVQQVAKSLGPSVTAGADVSSTESRSSSGYSNDATLSLTLTQRLYQGGGLNAQVRRAKASRDSVRANLLTVQRDVVQDVSDAFVRLQVARASLAASAEQVRAARVAFEGIREEATLGARTTLDVLSAEQELLDAQTAQISARAEESVAAYQLLSAQGLLTAEKLGLAVQIYDPTVYYNLAKDAPVKTSKQGRELDRVLKALGKK